VTLEIVGSVRSDCALTRTARVRNVRTVARAIRRALRHDFTGRSSRQSESVGQRRLPTPAVRDARNLKPLKQKWE
jgi:hypothetical protein